jgi:DNA repair exonuclease SbcCD nuclease subunit
MCSAAVASVAGPARGCAGLLDRAGGSWLEAGPFGRWLADTPNMEDACTATRGARGQSVESGSALLSDNQCRGLAAGAVSNPNQQGIPMVFAATPSACPGLSEVPATVGTAKPIPAKEPSLAQAITILHAADIHIDSPLRGLDRIGSAQLADTLRQATRRAFENLVDFAINRSVDAVVLAGDIYDGDAKDYGTARFFSEQMIRLDEAGIPVVMVTGNHDADSVITRTLHLPGNVHVLPTDTPGTIRFDDLAVAFHGQGFATKAVVANLAQQYPEPVDGLVNVGVLHTSVAGYEGHDPYAPCTVADLQSKGYEYYALGHIHQRQVLCQGRTTAAFSGNLQGRHIRETGPKGALVVTLEPGQPAAIEFVELDVARWEHLDIDASQAEDMAQVLGLVERAMTAARQQAGDRPVVARVSISGKTPAAGELADTERLREEVALVARRLDVVVERIRNKTALPAGAGHLSIDRDVLRDLAAELKDQEIARMLAKLKSETDPLLRDNGLLEPLQPDQIRDDALAQLTARLAGGK